MVGDFNTPAPENTTYQFIVSQGYHDIWLEKEFSPNLSRAQMCLVIASSLVFFNIVVTTQLTRQALSLVILLYAITSRSTKREIIFLILASITHLSSFVLYIIYKMVMKNPRVAVPAIAISVLVFVYSIGIILNSGLIHLPGLEKLLFYADKLDQGSGIYISGALPEDTASQMRQIIKSVV